jgi:hypothetical protein
MEKLKESSQIKDEDIASFFDYENIEQSEFVLAASHSKMPRTLVSKHVYIAAMSKTRLIMWAKRRTLSKSLSEISCSILFEDLKIQDTWSKKGKKSCELLFPDGQLIIIESINATDTFVENLVKITIDLTKPINDKTGEHVIIGEDIFPQEGVAQTKASTDALRDSLDAKAVKVINNPEIEKSAEKRGQESTKDIVVTRDVIIQSLERALDGSITIETLKNWAMKVRDIKIIDADEAMVSYILFSISRIDTQDKDAAKKLVEEYSERLNISLI